MDFYLSFRRNSQAADNTTDTHAGGAGEHGQYVEVYPGVYAVDGCCES